MNFKLPSDDYQKAIEIIRQTFAFPVEKQKAMVADFIQHMQRGLAGHPSHLKMIPAYMPLPTGQEEGCALAIDMGGTNLRLMVVKLSPRQAKPEIILLQKRKLAASEMNKDAHVLFSLIAGEINKLLLKLEESNSGNISTLENTGFTFSYPVEMVNSRTGRIVTLAKELTASGLVGNDPFDLLFYEFGNIAKQSVKFPLAALKPKALVNDTVTELIYGAYLKLLSGSPYPCRIGGIIGTGNNFAIVLDTRDIKKFQDPDYPFDKMIINLESGNFDDASLPKTLYDNAVDRCSNNAGNQRLEKMIAGNYLGKIAAEVLQDLLAAGHLFDGKPQAVNKLQNFTCVHMSEIETAFLEDNREKAEQQLKEIGFVKISALDLDRIHEVCTIVSGRAARIAGTNVAAIVKFLDPQLSEKHTVAIDGSVFGKYPGYREKMQLVLQDHFNIKTGNIKLEYISDGSGIGAAIAAGRK